MKGTTSPDFSRREFLAGASALGGMTMAPAAAAAQITTMAPFEKLPPYGNNTLPAGVRPRLVPNVNGLTVNMLEAGTQGRPLVLLLHGFPNLGYSWRKVMPASCRPRRKDGHDFRTSEAAADCRSCGGADQRRPPSRLSRLVLDELDRVTSIVADERKSLGRRVAHFEGHLHALGLQFGEHGGQILDLEAEVLHSVRPKVF